MNKATLIVLALLIVGGLVGLWGYYGFPMAPPPGTTTTPSSSSTTGTTSVLVLSVDMQRLKDRVGPERTRPNSFRFAVHLDASRLGEGWTTIMDPVAKKLFLDPPQRAAVTRFIRDVQGVTLVSHEKGDVFTHCIMQFQDNTGRNRRLIAPLHQDPGLVRETTNFVLNVTDDEAIATAVAAALGGS